MNDTKVQEYLEFAKRLAAEAGEIMLEYFRSNLLDTEWKKDNSPVTEADSKINRLVIERVKQTYPEHGILGEEESYEAEREALWVVDPIDGTGVYSVGMPCSTFCLALVITGEVQVSVVLDPFLKRLFTAVKGSGTYCNNKKLTVSKQAELKHGYFSVPADSREANGLLLPVQRNLRAQQAKILTIPSFTYMGLLVAEGSMLGACIPYGSPWDGAAISLIVTEAGGSATDFNGQERRYDRWSDGMLLSNGAVQDKLVELIKNARSRD